LIAALLSTKLHIPRYQQPSQQTSLVPRPHLLKFLDAGLAGKLTLIAAPAGFGKSTLLTEWIDATASARSKSVVAESKKQTHQPTFCWLSLEESDNDPVRFWLYFIAALHAKLPELNTDASILLLSPEPPPLETVLSILINDLVAWSTAATPAPAMSPAIVLVLEDYHSIESAAIHQSLAFLLDHLPPTLHIVITTRADPPLPLARLRARGQLLEIRSDELRFTAGETAVFLNECMGLELAPAEVQLLAERTEGWIVGLHLAALSMRGQKDKSNFVRSFSGSHRYVLVYLIEEVFRLQSQTVQEFLLYSCILTRLSGPLCDAVVGAGQRIDLGGTPPSAHTNSQALLEQLEQANLFLGPLDDLGQWYRYHQLFAEVLQYLLHRDQPEMLPILHHSASVWFAQQGYVADAIHHALLAEDFAGAAAQIDQAWPTLWNQGAIATLFNWMQALPISTEPDEAFWGRPNLYVSYSWGLALSGQIKEAETSLSQVESILQRTDAQVVESPILQTLLGRAAALHAMLAARHGNTTEAILRARQALALIPVEATSRGDAFYTLGLAQQQKGALAEALRAYTAAVELGEATQGRFLAIAAQYHGGRVLTAQGQLQRAAAAYQQILTTATQSQKQLPVVGLARIGYGEILYQWNDLEEAVRQIDMGLALNPRRDLTYTDGPLHRFNILARIRLAVGDQESALAAVGLAKETAKQTGIGIDIERSAALEAFIQLRTGEETLASRWAERYARTRTDAECLSYLREFETLVYVRVLLAQGRGAEALTLLTKWVPLVEAAQRWGSAIELYLLQVLAFRLDGQLDVATRRLARCLELAEPEDFVRLFVDEVEPMQQAIRDFTSWRSISPTAEAAAAITAYANRLLDAFTDAEALRSEIGVTGSAPIPQALRLNLIDPLTKRELEVLHLLTAGLSNAAIAEQLIVSVGTVKTHLKHIYGKLAVQSRTQAVAQARMLGLLTNDQPPS
jgi:LuxR family maltose regulon positive regulatory protein